MPDGEIYTAPINSTLDGSIYFEFPGVLSGRSIRDIYLEWDKGKLAHASSSSNQDYFQRLLKSDRGASLLGEFAFGTNYGIDRFCGDFLIDEKMGGTIHVALGRAYTECGGKNESAIHFDIVKDTREQGEVYLDDRLVFKNGRFTIP
jgi:aminopeptidase